MDIRIYGDGDREACLAVYESNVPEALNGAGREEFAAFLDARPGRLYVAEHGGAVVGCGGFEITGDTARLLWGIVGRQWQRQGVGRFLLFYRLREITRDGAVAYVHATVPRAVAPFFAAQGFREAGGDTEFAAMTKRLTVCA